MPLGGIVVGTENGLCPLDDPGRVLLAGHDIRCVARGDGELWAIDGTSIWRIDGGEPTKVATLRGREADSILATSKGEALVGVLGARLYRLGPTPEVVASFNAVDGRDSWYTPWGGPPTVRSLAEGPDGILYANVHVGGIVRSTDAGATWQPAGIDVDADVHQVIAHDTEPGFVLAATGDGFATSHDGGESWAFDNRGLAQTYCRAVAVAGDTVLVTASRSHAGEHAAIWRRPLGGERPFERCTEGLPAGFPDNIDTHCLAAAGPAAVFGTADGNVYRSEDDGRTWWTAVTGLARVHCVLFAD